MYDDETRIDNPISHDRIGPVRDEKDETRRKGTTLFDHVLVAKFTHKV
jgi:hypothetical protein